MYRVHFSDSAVLFKIKLDQPSVRIFVKVINCTETHNVFCHFFVFLGTRKPLNAKLTMASSSVAECLRHRTLNPF